MSGHSRWSTIKRKKGVTDSKRGKIFTKLIKELTAAARLGGGDPDGNPRLRAAISTAKTENMPKDNIERAIKKGTGELEGVRFEEHQLEGYAPGGVAVLIDVMTDNKNRTMADVRHIFSKHNATLADPGCVAYLFKKTGLINLDKDKVDEETVLNATLEAGAEDIRDEGSFLEVFTDPKNFETVKSALEERQLPYAMAEITMIPQSTVKVEGKEAELVLKLVETLEDSDDIQRVYANFDIPDEELERIGA